MNLCLNTYNPIFNAAYDNIVHRFELCGFIPIVTVEDVADAIPLAGAMTAAHTDILEITCRSACADECVRMIRKFCPSLLVGAGTVLTVEQVDKMHRAGAQFIVCPGFNPKVVDRCIELGVPVFPGCSNPSDFDALLDRGLRVAKFFPAELLGGPKMIQAYAAPYPFLRFIPTGGINPENIPTYLACNKVLCCSGTFVATEEDFRTGNYAAITGKAHDAVDAVVNLHCEKLTLYTDPKDEKNINDFFCRLEGTVNQTRLDSRINAVGVPEKRGMGCVLYSTPNIERALYYLSLRGFSPKMSTAVREQNRMTEVYLNETDAGFIVKLIRK